MSEAVSCGYGTRREGLSGVAVCNRTLIEKLLTDQAPKSPREGSTQEDVGESYTHLLSLVGHREEDDDARELERIEGNGISCKVSQRLQATSTMRPKRPLTTPASVRPRNRRQTTRWSKLLAKAVPTVMAPKDMIAKAIVILTVRILMRTGQTHSKVTYVA